MGGGAEAQRGAVQGPGVIAGLEDRQFGLETALLTHTALAAVITVDCGWLPGSRPSASSCPTRH